MDIAIASFVGMIVGAGVVLVIHVYSRRQSAELVRTLTEEAQAEKAAELERIIEQLRTQFSSLSREALSANAEDFLKLAKTRLDHQTGAAEQTLEGKKKLIDARLEEMGKRLGELHTAVQSAEKNRAQTAGSLTQHLERATQATHRLHDVTGHLREALASTQRRGQWGERMAEDVLRLAGLIEGVNYHKQRTQAGGGRPDYTFLLPNNQSVNMDVKFPLENYLKIVDAGDDNSRGVFTVQFLKDVRSRIREVTTRDYIDPAGSTVDYVLVFIPNEQIYAFIHEHDRTLLDDALRSKVVLCSPLTLYAVLAVIRQACENFQLEQASRQILELLGEFKKQWLKYVEQMDRIGKALDSATETYQSLTTTRTRQLDRQLDKLDDLRAAQEAGKAGQIPGPIVTKPGELE